MNKTVETKGFIRYIKGSGYDGSAQRIELVVSEATPLKFDAVNCDATLRVEIPDSDMSKKIKKMAGVVSEMNDIQLKMLETFFTSLFKGDEK